MSQPDPDCPRFVLSPDYELAGTVRINFTEALTQDRATELWQSILAIRGVTGCYCSREFLVAHLGTQAWFIGAERMIEAAVSAFFGQASAPVALLHPYAA